MKYKTLLIYRWWWWWKCVTYVANNQTVWFVLFEWNK